MQNCTLYRSCYVKVLIKLKNDKNFTLVKSAPQLTVLAQFKILVKSAKSADANELLLHLSIDISNLQLSLNSFDQFGSRRQLDANTGAETQAGGVLRARHVDRTVSSVSPFGDDHHQMNTFHHENPQFIGENPQFIGDEL